MHSYWQITKPNSSHKGFLDVHKVVTWYDIFRVKLALSRITDNNWFILLYCLIRIHLLKVQSLCNLQSRQERNWKFFLPSAPELKRPQPFLKILKNSLSFQNWIWDSCFWPFLVKQKQNTRKDLQSFLLNGNELSWGQAASLTLSSLPIGK